MVVNNESIPYTILDDKTRRKVLCHDGSMMMVEVTFDKDGIGVAHRHVHEQITYVAKGSFEFVIEGEAHIVRQGDSLYFPSNALHGCTALEDGILVDVFTPQREDFLK